MVSSSGRVSRAARAGLLLFAGLARAQLQPGELLVADGANGALLRVIPGGGTSTLLAIPGVTALCPGLLGTYLAGAGSSILLINTLGGVNTLRTGAPVQEVTALVPERSGAVAFVDRSARALFRYVPGGALSTLFSGPPLQAPNALAIDRNGDYLVSDGTANAIYRITAAGSVFLVSNRSELRSPIGIGFDAAGGIVVATAAAPPVLARVPPGGAFVVRSGPPFVTPSVLRLRGDTALVADGAAGAIFQVSASGAVTTLAALPAGIAPRALLETGERAGDLLVADRASRSLLRVSPTGSIRTVVTGAPFLGTEPDAIAPDHTDGYVIGADASVYRMTATGALSTLFRGPPLSSVSSVALFPNGDVLIGDTGASGLFRLTTAGTISTFFGGPPLAQVAGVAALGNGDVLVADAGARMLYRITPSRAVTTFFQGPPAVPMAGLAVDGSDAALITDPLGRSLLRVDASGMVSTLATGAPFMTPSGVTVDRDGSIFVSDPGARGLFRVIRGAGTLTVTSGSAALAGAAGVAVTRPVVTSQDYLVTDQGSLNRVLMIPRDGFPEPILDFDASLLGSPAAAAIDTWNRSLVVALVGAPGALVRVTRGGAFPIYQGSALGSPTSVAVDSDGSYLVTETQGTPALLRITERGVVTTVFSGAPIASPNAIAVDVDSGDYLVGDFNTSTLFRVTPAGAVSTFVTGVLLPSGISQDPWSGDFHATSVIGFLYRITRSGVASTVAGPPLDMGNAVSLEPDGNLIVADAGFQPNGLYRYNRTGALLGSFYSQPNADLIATSVGRAGSRHVVGTAAPLVGTTLPLQVSMPSDAGLAYYLAASSSLRPGISVDQRTIPLVVDSLLLLSLLNPAVFQGFSGILDRDGRSSAAIAIPNVNGLRGVRLFLAFVTVQPGSASGIRNISIPAGFTIR